MTPLIDGDGRLFGRLNLVDALCALFVVGLVPVAYGSLLLFRPPKPSIRSVEPAEVNKEERRIANGLVIRQKLKVRGDRLTPMLRATIDDTPAIGFTFESPASADVIVGDNVPMGTHDLILYDGAQEVARARGAVAILPTPAAAMRVVGALIQLDEPTAKGLHVGQRFEIDGHPAAELLQLGEVEPDRHRIKAPPDNVEAPVSGSWQRAVIMRIHCEPDPDATLCRIGNATLGDPRVTVLNVPGAAQLRVLVSEVLPDSAPQRATARIHVAGQREVADLIRPGDRDIRGGGLDERTATVAGVRRESDGFEVALQLGLDRSAEGWRYKAQLIEPGTSFTLTTSRYSVSGSIVNIVVDGH